MAFIVTLHNAGVQGVLMSRDARELVFNAALKVAANARSQGMKLRDGSDLPIEEDVYTTDRAAASVLLAHPAGIGMQAKHGVLTKAAAEAGLEVKKPKGKA